MPNRFILVLLSLLFISLVSGCTIDDKITKHEAETIVLKDAANFEPENSEFEVYYTEESKRGWVIVISSLDPDFKEPSPNIWYEISQRGKILEKENMAVSE